MKLTVSVPLSRRIAGCSLGVVLLALWVVTPSAGRAQGCDSINSPCSLGLLTNNVLRNGRVYGGSPVDFYEFTIPSGPVREVTASISSASLSGTISLSLVRDANRDGIADDLMTTSGYTFRDASIVMWLDPGTYFVRVQQGNASTDTGYQLWLTQVAHPESKGNNDNNPGSERVLTAGQPFTEYVGTNDTVDLFRFVVSGQVMAVTGRVASASLSSTIGLSLLRDGTVIASSPGFTFADGLVWAWLDPGSYVLKVECVSPASINNNTRYQLQLSESPRPDSRGTNDNRRTTARVFIPGQPLMDYVGTNDPVDYFSFTVPSPNTDVTVLVPGNSLSPSQPRLTLSLLDGVGNVLATDQAQGPSLPNDAFLSRQLAPGNYYVRIEHAAASANTLYLLGISGPPPPPLPCVQLGGDLAFGNVAVGTTATRTLIISNNGAATLNVSSITLPVNFGGSFNGSIQAGAAAQVNITFTPGSFSSFSGFLQVHSDAGVCGVSTLPVSGTGTPPPTRILVLSGNLHFPNPVEVGRSDTASITLSNAGNSPLTVSRIEYSLSAFSGDFQGVVPPGGATVVPVTFVPASVGSYNGTIKVISDLTSGMDTISCTATGTVPVPRCLGLLGHLNFGEVEQYRSSNRVVVLTNYGQAEIRITGVSAPPEFQVGLFNPILVPGGWRTVTVSYAPLSVGPVPDGLQIEFQGDQNCGSNSIPVSGSGAPPLLRCLQLSGDTNFGTVAISANSIRSLTLANLGGQAPLRVTNLTFSSSVFSGTFSGVIPAGGSVAVPVHFAPTATGEVRATLTVHADSTPGCGTNSIVLTGMGSPAPYSGGTYVGLFRQADAARHASSGYFRIVMRPDRTYSAQVRLAGINYEPSGRFSPAGWATNRIVRPGRETVTIAWRSPQEDPDEIVSQMSAISWDATMYGRRIVPLSGTGTNVSPFAGRYTLLIRGVPLATEEPEGDGFALITVSAKGVATLAGSLADGIALSQSTPVSPSGWMPLYASLYGGRGSILGWLQFTNAPLSDLTGSVDWNRPPSTTVGIPYPQGFEVHTAVTGSRFLPPVGVTNRILAITNAVVAFSGGGLAEPLDCNIVIGANHRVTNTSPHKVTLVFTKPDGQPYNGMFSGTFIPPGASKGVPFKGAVLQKLNLGAGHFVRSNLSGHVFLSPRKAP